jgi:hypothetical protein
MKLLSKHRNALNKACPYCKAKAKERCKVIHGNVHTIGAEPRDQWGRPLIHNQRIK